VLRCTTEMNILNGDSAEENMSFNECSASNRLDFFVTFFVKKKSKKNT
jgi:hypothetical protein